MTDTPPRRDWASPAMIAFSLGASAYAWPRVGPRVPVRWDAAGDPAAFAGRAAGLLLVPLLAAALWAGMRLAARLVPEPEKAVVLCRTATLTVGLLATLHALTLADTLGADTARLAMPATGLFLIALARLIGRAGPAAVNGPFDEAVKERMAKACGVALDVSGLAFIAAGVVGTAWATYAAIGVSVLACPAALTWAGAGGRTRT